MFTRALLFRAGGAAVGAFGVYQYVKSPEWYHYVAAGAAGYAVGAIADTALASAMPSAPATTTPAQA